MNDGVNRGKRVAEASIFAVDNQVMSFEKIGSEDGVCNLGNEECPGEATAKSFYCKRAGALSDNIDFGTIGRLEGRGKCRFPVDSSFNW